MRSWKLATVWRRKNGGVIRMKDSRKEGKTKEEGRRGKCEGWGREVGKQKKDGRKVRGRDEMRRGRWRGKNKCREM
jgi:hypothetical protein